MGLGAPSVPDLAGLTADRSRWSWSGGLRSRFGQIVASIRACLSEIQWSAVHCILPDWTLCSSNSRWKPKLHLNLFYVHLQFVRKNLVAKFASLPLLRVVFPRNFDNICLGVCGLLLGTCAVLIIRNHEIRRLLYAFYHISTLVNLTEACDLQMIKTA